ncbi:histidine kinase [Aphanothece hegewaldii CCALA 016]|uniref:Histidine kinase n=1 Tax=Aphanothece hegewaldii CCALA 016 TaxID=2107694 RepID=A0A2T1LW22_9CHRO|nr:CHASE2 domain-containing protein [Aphanothece hegewaldii]PSF36058.1 histidine kinase [Aphanothece hegewaldii CCALA 016]
MMWAKIGTKLQRLPFGIVPGLTLTGLILLTRSLGLFQHFELSALDLLLRYRPFETLDERIVIVGIDEQDIKKLRQYPVADVEIATLITTLQQYKPRAIGLDIVRDLRVEPGYLERQKTLSDSQNLIVIEKVLKPSIAPPQNIPPSQIGFSDVIPDFDGQYRRILLGIPTKQDYKFSLSLRLAELYLAKENITLENGIHDPQTMRFGKTELPRFYPNTGGYVGTDAGGVQMLLNYRNSHNISPFRLLSLNDIKNNNFEPKWLEDKIILIGITSPSAPDLVNTNALNHSQLYGQIYGVEFQAHGISQILSAVLDNRPFLRTMSEGWEYLWIIAWGMLGIYLSRVTVTPLNNLLMIILSSFSLILICSLVLLIGWWLPVVPSLLTLVLNGVILTAFYQYEQKLQVKLEEHQRTIEHTFTVIHNGPLQTLAIVLRSLREKNVSQSELLQQLETLNLEIREIGDYLKQESITQDDSLRLGSGLKLNLAQPLHELLYEVFSNTLERNFPHFTTLKVKIRSFEPIDSGDLSNEEKRQLCQFLEEAICNVGKHASGVKKISAIGSIKNNWYTLTIQDNGKKSKITTTGRGTKQCQNLAKQLGGTFKREAIEPNGTCCELSWPLKSAPLRQDRKRSLF